MQSVHHYGSGRRADDHLLGERTFLGASGGRNIPEAISGERRMYAEPTVLRAMLHYGDEGERLSNAS
jgi:hypothetical protein